MPIRFVDKGATISGRVTTTLASFSTDFDGTFTAAPSRTGSVATQLGNHSAAFAGVFQANANRVGTIASTLSGVSSSFIGTLPSAADWAAMIADEGLFYIDSLETITPGVNLDNPNTNGIFIDTSIKPAGMTGSARVPVNNSNSAGNGNLWIQFAGGKSINEGETFYIQFAQYMPRIYRDQVYPTSSGSRRGYKQLIIDRFLQTNSIQEIVLQSRSDRAIAAYNQNASTFVDLAANVSTVSSGSQLSYQNAIDRGSNPLTGSNPDDGSGWTGAQQDYARYGALESGNTRANDWAYGLGQVRGGAYLYPADEWAWYTVRVVVGKRGQSNSRVTVAVSSESSPSPAVIIDVGGVRIDTPSGSQTSGFTGGANTCFHTDRVAGGSRVTSRTNNIAAMLVSSIGLGLPSGTHTINYTASNRRFTLTPAGGGSVGAACGITTAQNSANLYDSTSASGYDSGRYIGIVVPNVAALPATDQLEQITVATNGREDTFTCFSQRRAGSSALKHPGRRVVPYSALATAAGALAEGEWNQSVPMTGFTTSLVTGGVNGTKNIFEFCRRGYFDPINRRLVFDGSSHDNPGLSRSRTIAMNESLAWSTLANPGMNQDGGNGGLHTGCDFTLDPATGTCYARRYGDDRTTMILPSGSSTWTTTGFADIPSSLPKQDQTALEWHPDLFSGGRGMVYGNEGGILLYNLSTDSWAFSPSGPSYPNIMGSFNNVSLFCRRNRCVYVGGGNGGGPSTNWWRVGANGIPVARTSLPHSVSVSGNDGYAFPSVGNNWPILLDRASGTLREFNDTSGSGTYTVIGSLPTGAFRTVVTNSNGQWAAFPIDEYGVIFFVYLQLGGSTPSTNGVMWKPPRSA